MLLLNKKLLHCIILIAFSKSSKCISNFSFCLFLQHIQEVTGYVLVSRITGYYIDLSSLRLIRGNEPISSPQQFCSQPIKNTNLVESYSLYVFDNSEDGAGLRELWMPNLSGILIMTLMPAYA